MDFVDRRMPVGIVQGDRPPKTRRLAKDSRQTECGRLTKRRSN